mgnify:CR=1 FL=1
MFDNTVVTTIMSNFGLYKAFEREGISYVKTAVGDKYVYENMAATGNCLGGEQSGHIIFSKHATTGDGILTSLKVMEVVLEKKQPLDKLASEVEIYPQVLKNVRVKDKKEARMTGLSRQRLPGWLKVWALTAGSFCASPVRNRWCALWWRPRLWIYVKNMWTRSLT